MKVREYTDSDMSRLVELHKDSGFAYSLPPMNTLFSKRVVDDGTVGMAALQRLTSEVYLL